MHQDFVERIIQTLSEKKLRIAFAESCTAGLAADAIVRVPGASQVFWGSFVTYSLDAKMKLLGIDPPLLAKYGAVSEECALAMANGALVKSGVDLALSVTGLAGPESDGSGLPVGTVWIGWSGNMLDSGASCYQFLGSRSEIRESAAECVIKKLAEILETL
jgi:PncC family amidohydrolase